ncbi:MAG: hypothetical protein U0894_03865 [Pirellulales bacterium]
MAGEKLELGNPAAYREYAEELSEHRKDPEAMAMAIELYLRSAQLEKGDGRNSALRGLVAAARSASERRRPVSLQYRCRRIAFCVAGLSSSGGKAEAAAGGAFSSELRHLRESDFCSSCRAVRVGRAPGNSPQGQAILDHFPSYLKPRRSSL